MSCTRFQRELSQSLDGRLPGARRSAVMTHIDGCAACAQAWEEMQATQSLLLDLEPARLGNGFRDRVWERIQSGEGAPEILLQEPVSAGTKLRYGLLGAAAAAVVVVGLQLFTTDTQDPTPNTEAIAANDQLGQIDDPSHSQSVATDESDAPRDLPRQIPGPHTPDPRPIERTLRMANVPSAFSAPTMTAGHLASDTVGRVTTAAKQLRLFRGRILQQAPLERTIQIQVQNCVRTIEGGVFVLDFLRRKDLLELEASSQECLAATCNIIKLHRTNDKNKAYDLVRTLDGCQLDRLNEISYKVKLSQLQDQANPLAEMFLDETFRSMLKFVAPRRDVFLQLMIQSTPTDSNVRIGIPSIRWSSETGTVAPARPEKRLQKRD